MKKIVLAMTTAAVFSAAHAGSMGPVSTMASYTPYLTGEASYTWPQSNNPTFTGLSTTSSSQGWGGRLGAGMLYNYNEKLGFTGEIGGGYYGSQDRNLSGSMGNAGHMNYSIDGYDMLAGFVYKWNYFDVFFQGGFMMQNRRVSQSLDLAQTMPGSTMMGRSNVNANTSQTLPEIKVGGIYNINPNWGIDVAYMHVFGSTPSMTSDYSGTLGTGLTSNVSANLQNPTLDAVMFGLHYNFVM